MACVAPEWRSDAGTGDRSAGCRRDGAVGANGIDGSPCATSVHRAGRARCRDVLAQYRRRGESGTHARGGSVR